MAFSHYITQKAIEKSHVFAEAYEEFKKQLLQMGYTNPGIEIVREPDTYRTLIQARAWFSSVVVCHEVTIEEFPSYYGATLIYQTIAQALTAILRDYGKWAARNANGLVHGK